MRTGDLKRAVEDIILRPEDNNVAELSKRSTIAALDLCQLEPTASTTPKAPTAAAINSCSCSSEAVPLSLSQPSPSLQQPLCMSTSLDTVVLRHSLSRANPVSRRSSRVHPPLLFASKRKRSNSVSSCYKGQQSAATASSLPPTARQTPFRFGDDDGCQQASTSTDSHSSLAANPDEWPRDEFVAEEDEVDFNRDSNELEAEDVNGISKESVWSAFRQGMREDEDMDCD